jgi:hypothetical protein
MTDSVAMVSSLSLLGGHHRSAPDKRLERLIVRSFTGNSAPLWPAKEPVTLRKVR